MAQEQKINSKDEGIQEDWRPLPFLGTSTLVGKILFCLRVIFDLRMNAVFVEAKKLLPTLKGRVLDVGCGAQPWRWMLSHCQYTGLEIYHSQEQFGYGEASDTVYGDGKEFPFRDESFESMICTEVLEHVVDSQRFLLSCQRCLKKGGTLFLTVPFSARYHYIPYDYWRFTYSALKLLFQNAGFKQFTIQPLGTDVGVVINKINVFIMKLLLPSRGQIFSRALKMLIGLLFLPAFVLLTLLGLFSIRFKIGSFDDPLGYSVIAKKE